MKEKLNSFNGLDFKKIISGLTGVLMITTGLLVMVPMTMPNAEAYMTPGAGVIWNFDDLVAFSGGAVIGAFPNYQILDPILTIAPTDTIVLMGGEDVMCAPGGIIEVQGTFDGMMGMGSVFHRMGIPGDWQGFMVLPMGNFMINGVGIFDAFDGVFADNTIMTHIEGSYISNCLNSGITYNMVMGGPMIGFNDISFNGVGIISTDSSSQIIENDIHDNLADGIMLGGWAGPWLDHNDIHDNQGDGITCLNLDGASFSNNDIYDNRGNGVSLVNSFVDLMGNRIYGWNATPGSNLPGSNAVDILGPATFGIWMSMNTIMGGNGDSYGIGMPRPDGGHGIYTLNYEGNAAGWPQLNIDNNPLIQGGNGGFNTFDDGTAGHGGDAIRIEGIPDIGDPGTDNEALRITDNGQILGGRGGENTCMMNGDAGDGGYGIRIIEDDFVGSQEISLNTFIRGGDGGYNFADDMGGGNWRCGDGGDGIYIQDAWMMVPTEVLNNPHVEGGNGGNGTGTGQFKKAGKGGDGIHFKAVTNATIDPTIAFGGDGGNTTSTLILAGDGGDGILIDAFSDRFSVVNLIDVNGTGGEGGDNCLAGGPGGGGAGTGGDGLEVDGASMALSQNSNYTGGKGGDTYADMDMGGMGGKGVRVWNGSNFNANVGKIMGGNGGDSLYNGPPTGSSGGWGGAGLFGWSASTVIGVQNQIIISGGIGGHVYFDSNGLPGIGGNGVSVSSADNPFFTGNEITAGAGGYNFASGASGKNGSYGAYFGSITGNCDFSFNVVHDTRWSGIRFMNTNGSISQNEVYNIVGEISVYGNGIEIEQGSPLVQDNNIHDVNNGIRLDNSASDIIQNTIDNCSNYGMHLSGGVTSAFSRTDINNTDVGVYALNGTVSTFTNCTITNTVGPCWMITGNSQLTSLNTSNDKSVSILHPLSILTMQWYMHTQVVDQFLAPVGGAEVWINDTFGTNILNAFTPATGWLNWTVVTEFIEDQAVRTYYTEHNGTAISGLQTGYATPEPFMDASREVIIVLGASVYNIFLNQGWNLISLPLIQADESIDQVLRTIDGQWDYIRIYDPLDPKPWKSNATFKPGSVNDLDTLNHTQGFWIDITTASATLTVTGTEPVSTDIPLYAGWNLVGYPSLIEMSISGALAGTGYDRPVEGFDITEPYDIKQLPDTYFMKPGEAYWIHVPVDTIWTVENGVGMSMPYLVAGFVYLYDGTSAGGYAPLASSGGAMVEITWWDVYNGWRTELTPTDAIGTYMYDLRNYSDGGVVYINATFDAPYNNRGYNYTYINVGMGMSFQEVVCGVPYVVRPGPASTFPGPPKPAGVPFPADYEFVDRNGMPAQGYFTFADGAIEWSSSDPMFFPPLFSIFEGTSDASPGYRIEMVTLFTPGLQTLNVTETVCNSYLTPWGQFYIDPFNQIQGWMRDWAEWFVQVS